jgi:DNA (cytosine-5)-methyltransferase 1
VKQENVRFTCASLFTGIGCMDLAAEWAGFSVIWQCDIDKFCRKVLKKHWPRIPQYGDIKKLNPAELERPDLLLGSWPCQPYSVAGLKLGSEDERALWDENFRILKGLRPRWFVGENVDNFANMEDFEKANKELEEIGYKVQSFVTSAASVGAPHRRNRLFMVAYSDSEPELQANKAVSTFGSEWEAWEGFTRWAGGDISRTYWETYQSPVCGMDDGPASELDKSRLIALGNAVVPQQIYPIFKTIMEIERMKAK